MLSMPFRLQRAVRTTLWIRSCHRWSKSNFYFSKAQLSSDYNVGIPGLSSAYWSCPAGASTRTRTSSPSPLRRAWSSFRPRPASWSLRSWTGCWWSTAGTTAASGSPTSFLSFPDGTNEEKETVGERIWPDEKNVKNNKSVCFSYFGCFNRPWW